MTKPTIYTVAHPEDLSPPMANQGFCVDVVLASDYALLQQEISALDAINRQLNKRVVAQAEELAEAGKTIEALAAENARMQSAIERHKEGFTICEACGEENGSWNDDVCRVLGETTATDAAIAEFRAQGVELFEQQMHADITNTDALEFAQQLRAEASK